MELPPSSDARADLTGHWHLPVGAIRWWPFLLLLAVASYGLLAVTFLAPMPRLADGPPIFTGGGSPSVQLTRLSYQTAPLQSVLSRRAWRDDAGWTVLDPSHSGLGYPYQPVTYRLDIENRSGHLVRKHLVVPAPSLDHLAPALIQPEGTVELLAALGDRYPFEDRYAALPQWIWPVTLQPGRSLVLIEVRNAGPTLLPIRLEEADEVVSDGALSLTWKAFLTGLLVFALLLNLSIVNKLGHPGLIWLSVFMACVIYSQLVLDGLGLWLLWPRFPELNALLGVALPLALIALLESIRFFLPVTRRAFRVLRTLSLVAGLHLLAAPFAGFLPGQDAFLVTSALGGLFILALVLRHRHHLYGPYLILSVLAILAGATLTALRTIGLLPVNGLTDSAFFLGAASGSLVLTSGVGRLLLQERKRRLVSDRQVRQEQQLRARIEREYDRLLKTHRVTGKPNRPMLEEALDNLDSQATPYTLCIVRLTRFAELEQTLGYRTSEQVLRQYLSKMNGFLKRALGDRLVMINGYALATIDTSHHAFAFYRHGDDDPALLETVAGWLGQRYQEGRFAFSWGPTLGVAHAPEHGRDAASILASAGFAALDRQGPITVYDPAIAEWQTRQQTLMLGLEQALASGDMSLAYQPKVRIEDRRVMSVEALIRWRHREFGTISPEQWIPLAEEVGLIHPVTLWVLARACHDYPRLQQQHGPELRVSVNISAKDLALPQFPGELLDITRRHRLAPDRIILEITETAVMNDPESARSTLRQLGQAGFGIALDDFSIGHSSLSALATFDLDELKIDRSFLKDILDNPKRERILRMALGLGEALGVTVVVEGVEDAAVAGWLSQFPGLHGQGYYWGRPSPLPPDGGQRTPPD